MKIKTALKIIGEIGYLRSLIKRYGDSLANGKYYLYNSFRALSLDEPSSRERSYPYFNRTNANPRFASLALKLNKFGAFHNRNKKTRGEYEAIYVANNHDKVREVKLFSFKRGKILTLCTCCDEMEKQLTQYESFSKSFNMPMVKASDKYQNAIEISMVDLREFPGDKAALDGIALTNANANYGRTLHSKTVKELIEFSYDNDEMNSLLSELTSKIDPSLLYLPIPLCPQHGDLSKDNLMYGESDGVTDFWWIDWEHAGERVFFYDYFFYVLNSAIYFDKNALDCYLNGEADEGLRRLFESAGSSFDPNKRKDIFLIFAVVFLKERVCDKGFLSALKTYCKFISDNLF